jgi:hypothetical protein
MSNKERGEKIRRQIVRVRQIRPHNTYATDSGVQSRIGLATSDDGNTWVKDADNPILSRGTGLE